MGKILPDLEFGKEFRLDTKNTIKENNFIKIKVFCASKDTVKKVKDNPPELELFINHKPYM